MSLAEVVATEGCQLVGPLGVAVAVPLPVTAAAMSVSERLWIFQKNVGDLAWAC